MTGPVMFAPRRANRRFRLRTEDYMPRHFGLKATSAAPRTAPATASILVRILNASRSVQKTLPPVSYAASKLSSQSLELPLSPASWRGGRARRSISPR